MFTIAAVLSFVAVTLVGCSNNDKSIKTSAGYPPVKLDTADLPTHAVGDSLTFNNPDETWTIVGIRDGLIKWKSSLNAEKITIFDPVLPPIVWSKTDSTGGSERLTDWDKSLFPLKGGQKIAFKTLAQHRGRRAQLAFTWKCYSGGPRKVNIQAGEFPAYPIFCRRSDGLTRQSFYAPKVNGPLLITTRRRPAPAVTRELIEFKSGPGPRVAATGFGNLPKGWALAAVDSSARARVGRQTPAQVAAVREKNEKATTKVNSEPRSVTVPITSPPPAIAPPPRILPPNSAIARGSDQEALTSVAIGAPQSPIIPSSRVSRLPRPDMLRPAPRPVANVGKKAQVAQSTRPSLPSIQAPASIFGRRTAPSPPVIALPTPTTKSKKAPSANISKRAADRIQKRTTLQSAGGAFGVQLGSYGNPKMAKDGWSILRRQYGSLLKNWDHLVKSVDLGPSRGKFYRLIAGPAQSRASAEALCTAIKAQGKSCLVRSIKN